MRVRARGFSYNQTEHRQATQITSLFLPIVDFILFCKCEMWCCGAVVLCCCGRYIYMNRAPEHHAVILFLSVRVWSDDLPSTISQSTRKYYSFDDKLGTTMPTYFRLAIHTKKKKKKGPNCKDKQFEAHLLFHQLHST